MFSMRLKLGSERNKEWRCCLCLHVRSATILFGIWHLVLHILALTVLALIMRNHHVIVQRNEELQNDFLPTPLSKKDDDNPYYLPTTQDGRNIYSSDIDMGALMTVCTLSITLLMVYGTIKGKPTHLLPFFCLQLFDFAITTLTATGYFCYLRSAHRLIAEHWNLPFRYELLQLSPQMLTLVVLLAFLFSMLWKAYWISIVWRCYKYLTFRLQSTRNTIHYIIPEPDRVNEHDYPSLFRDHEAVFGSAMKQTPPPSYQDIMDDQPPPYPTSIVSHVQETPYRMELHTTDVVEIQEPTTSNEVPKPDESVEVPTSSVDVPQTNDEQSTETDKKNSEVADEVSDVVEKQELEDKPLNDNSHSGPKDI
ncbi:lysosomal-associated transmembrane protein 4B [Leptinotarsa decemlineata]|uniref:lysosomal-associated transmembrane protein 4B n=1 Tax=Leptinotarsa decemlineata TaxID=7539 RepID=UPI003D308895